MTSSTTLSLVRSAQTPEDQLERLKDLKNLIIGNTWKKVDVVEDEGLLNYLLSLLDLSGGLDKGKTPVRPSAAQVDIVNETAVIIGALASVGTLTLRPLIIASTPLYLINLIRCLSITDDTTQFRLLPPTLRALRNILISTADTVWGHIWGVGSEQKVVETGLLEGRTVVDVKGKGVAGRERDTKWRIQATSALALVFEPDNLNTLLPLLYLQPDAQIQLPLYQLLARLVILPKHRATLAKWTPSYTSRYNPSSESTSTNAPSPYILEHLLTSIARIAHPKYSGRNPNAKLLEAAIDLLSAVIRGQTADFINPVKTWGSASAAEMEGPIESSVDVDLAGPNGIPLFVRLLLLLLDTGTTGVRISIINCLTQITKSDKSTRTADKAITAFVNSQLLREMVALLGGESVEDRVKICFILAALVSDDAVLQLKAGAMKYPEKVVGVLRDIVSGEEKGEIGVDLASRAKEATLLALASLAFQNESARTVIAESTPSTLQYLLKALSHPSYGVRAAACQLARALSRTVAILRTSLVDSGVGQEVIEVLKREVSARKFREEWEESEERVWTVEVASSATICNLIADFSPLKSAIIQGTNLSLLCELTSSPHLPLAQNALWALKNLSFHALDTLKSQITMTLTFTRLRALLAGETAGVLRVQAMELVQNLLADCTQGELARVFEGLGEGAFLDVVGGCLGEVGGESVDDGEREGGGNDDLRIPALYVLSNLALGNERLRRALTSRVEILEGLSIALNAKSEPLKVPALRCIRHLLESNAKTHKPRQGVLDLFQPYQLRTRVRDLVDGSISLDVRQAGVCLLDVLERGREGVNSGGR